LAEAFLLTGTAIWLSVYAASLKRARSVALLRVLGGERDTVFGVVLLETDVTLLLDLLLGVGLSSLVSVLAGQL